MQSQSLKLELESRVQRFGLGVTGVHFEGLLVVEIRFLELQVVEVPQR